MHVLVIQLARFGDYLQTTPLLSALKNGGGADRLTVLVNRPMVETARTNPHVDQVLSVDLESLGETAGNLNIGTVDKIGQFHGMLGFLKDHCFDRVINLNTSRVAALISELVRAGQRDGARLAKDRSGLRTAPWTGFIMDLMARRSLIRFNLVDLLLNYAGDASPLPRQLTSPLNGSAGEASGSVVEVLAGHGPLVGFQVGSRHTSRQWPPDRFARLADLLTGSLQARICLLGTRPERDLGYAVLAHLKKISPDGPSRVINLMGRTSISELAEVVSRLDLLVTTDTGTMHLAAALQIPILGLFMGPAFCHETGPFGEGHLILQARPECSPCTEGQPVCDDAFCRRLISAELAARAAGRILAPEKYGPLTAEDLGPDVRAYRSAFDDFGLVFQPLAPWPLDRANLLAYAYREAGRSFFRPGYVTDQRQLGMELARYAPPRSNLDDLIVQAGTWRGFRPGMFPGPATDPDLGPLNRMVNRLIKRGEARKAEKILNDMSTAIETCAGLFGGSSRPVGEAAGIKHCQPWDDATII